MKKYGKPIETDNKEDKIQSNMIVDKTDTKSFSLSNGIKFQTKLLIEATKEPLTELVSQHRDEPTQNTYIEFLVRLGDLPLNVIKAKCTSKQKPDGKKSTGNEEA